MAGVNFTARMAPLSIANNGIRILRARSPDANTQIKCTGAKITMDGVTAADEPVLVELIRASGGAAWVQTNQTTGLHHRILGITPRSVIENRADNTGLTIEVIESWEVHNQGSLVDFEFQLSREYWLTGVGTALSGTLALRATAPGTFVQSNISLSLRLEE